MEADSSLQTSDTDKSLKLTLNTHKSRKLMGPCDANCVLITTAVQFFTQWLLKLKLWVS